MIDKPGIYSVPMADYQADTITRYATLSSGIAKRLITLSPLHAWTAHPRLNPNFVREDKSEFDLGQAAHSMLLEAGAGLEVIDPELYRSKPTKANPEGNVPAGWTNDAIREARDAARLAGKVPVLPRQMAEIELMAKIAREYIESSPDLSGLRLSDGKAEQTLVWQEGDVWCRARPDWISDDRKIQISYKSTATSANPHDWVRTGIGIGADLQEAFYMRGNARSGGPEDGKSIILVQENSAPYACALVGLDPAFLALANDKCEEAIGIWRACIKSGEWPGYANRVHWLEAPQWEVGKWLERSGAESLEEMLDRRMQP